MNKVKTNSSFSKNCPHRELFLFHVWPHSEEGEESGFPEHLSEAYTEPCQTCTIELFLQN